MNHSYIGTEHLLLGLLGEGRGLAAQSLIEMGIHLKKVREAVEFIVGTEEGAAAPGEPALTPQTKKVIEMAVDITKSLTLENELRIAHSYLSTMVSESVDAIIAIDEDDEIVIVNRAARRLFRLSDE